MIVTRIRPAAGGTDRYGDPIPGTPTETELVGAFFAPGATADIIGPGRDGVRVDGTLYAPHGTDLTSADTVRIEGDGVNDGVYRIEGQPADWSFRLGSNRPARQVALLTRAEG